MTKRKTEAVQCYVFVIMEVSRERGLFLSVKTFSASIPEH